MDEIVRAALQKWPNVPHCRGWLGLDARGDWYMRDEQVQAAGAFPQAKGSRVEHDKLRAFIARNYASDETGAWFFQNGPQRVYVELEAAPWVWRLDADADSDDAGGLRISSHTGQAARFEQALTDQHGRLFLVTDLGFGLVHTQDMNLAAQQVESGAWPVVDSTYDELRQRHRFEISPWAAAAAEAPRQA